MAPSWPRSSFPHFRIALALVFTALVAAIAGTWWWNARNQHHKPSARALELYLEGIHNRSRRDIDGTEIALQKFEAAPKEDPNYPQACVLPPGESYDSAHDLTFLLSIGSFGALPDLVIINGSPQSRTLRLKTGQKYRFRFINITTNNQGIQLSLLDAAGRPAQWKMIAKDGADLPASQVRAKPARVTITVGETFDVEFTSETSQDLVLDVLLPAQKIHISQTLAFAP